MTTLELCVGTRPFASTWKATTTALASLESGISEDNEFLCFKNELPFKDSIIDEKSISLVARIAIALSEEHMRQFLSGKRTFLSLLKHEIKARKRQRQSMR